MLERWYALVASAILLWAAALASPARAEPMPSDLARGFDEIFRRAQVTGMVAAVVDGERTYVAGFGRARAGRAGRPDGRTLVRINSLTKVMTGEVLANLVAEHRVALGDPLARYAPPGRLVPARAGAGPITLLDLAAHTSGLPRDNPPGLSADGRWTWLGRWKPARGPGRIAQYSNAAYMFLGDALERASGESTADLIGKYVTAPLGLADTTFAPSAEQCARLMTNGTTTHPCRPTFDIAAMGGLYATADDMSLWLRAHLDAAKGSARDATQRPLVRRANLDRMIALDFAGPVDAVAMGWLVMRLDGTYALQKTGGGGGFMNYAILAPEKRKAIFVTVSRVDIEMLRRLTIRTNRIMRRLMR
jgi:D-alanyl-D-alanine-carboxypeptidase/D-alanyl-D-alanine-endopeptidase